ncbi:non-specific lipid-transfer protein [Lingula anatina]|uniref:Sterol carrier protein 2 n=1 Tax=Lingula anatina TaxID=7574 RepID=A0A1S3JBL1_LINAN|nr:non-specific lipid-transfer protein [Lingula anatina]|eukprot:XP_013407713.1 non-specific lipid-transfer protein [Lingula anatina]
MAAPRRRVFVVGVGMTKFEKPGRRDEFDYPDMAKESASKALKDAGISYNEVQQVCVGYVYGDTTCGQRAVYQLGMTGVPVYNVNNACSTGSTALLMAKQFIEGGLSDCVMALGFEKMERGSLSAKYTDRTNPMDKHVEVMANTFGLEPSPVTAQMFGNAGREHMEKYGTKPVHFAKIAYKNHKHSVNNPYSQFRKEYTLEEIAASPSIHNPLTKLQCCPTSDGSACAVVASEEFVKRHGLQAQAVEILGMEMATDLPTTFQENSCMKMVGYDMTKAAADRLFKKTGVSVKDVDVVELHDCFSANELISYEALGLCEPGKAGELIDRGDNTYGGKFVVNPSGGLISKGHPLGATGLAQCSELCWQLRGLAGKRQVPGAKLALQHNIGLGGAVVVALYRMGFPEYHRTGRIQAMPTSAQVADFKSAALFDLMTKEIEKDGANLVKKVKAVYCFKVTGAGGKTGCWVVDCKNGSGSVKFDPNGKGDVTITMSDDDMIKMAMGKLNSQQAFFSGKLKITGNMALAMKLQQIMPKPGTGGTLKAKL